MELIDKQKLISNLEWHAVSSRTLITDRPCIYEIIEKVKAEHVIDAVEVVRCKDCAYSMPNDGKLVEGARYCSLKYDVAGLSYFDVWDNDYCSCGKRKDLSLEKTIDKTSNNKEMQE